MSKTDILVLIFCGISIGLMIPPAVSLIWGWIKDEIIEIVRKSNKGK